jgi:nitroreductase
LLAAIAARHAKRAFLPTPVPRPLLERVLACAANAPSSRNTQPWQVAVLRGESRRALAGELVARFDAGEPPRADFRNHPEPLAGVLAERAGVAGAGLLAARGIARDDEAGRRAHHRDNFRFYGAPVAMIFHLPADAVPGSFLAMGLFLENVLLGLSACGLGSCPQYSVAGYADAIREHLGLGRDRLIVCGLAVGYPDPEAPVNGFAPPRAPLADYVRWFD